MTKATDMGGAAAASEHELVDVAIEDEAWRAALGEGLEPLIGSAARAALHAVEIPDETIDEAGLGIAVLLTDDPGIARLNADFRGKPTPTNVLSWPSVAWEGPADPAALPGALARCGGHLGDVALALGVVRREAAAEDKTLEDHIRHLIVHGVLHLLGYDHTSDDEAALMEALERAALAAIGVADPYAAERVVEGGDG